MNYMTSCKAIKVDSAYLAGEVVGLQGWWGLNIFGTRGTTNTGH